MEITNGLRVEYKGGKLVAELDIAVPITAKLNDIKAKIESGEIDLIKGTDLEKMPMIKAIDIIIAEINKPEKMIS